MSSEKLNYHKLVNLRKRFDKYGDCDISNKEIVVAVIEKHLVLEKEKSKKKDIDRRLDYQYCALCYWMMWLIYTAKSY